MPPIHLAGEMAVWTEEKWAALECTLQRQLRAERRRLARLAARRRRAQAFLHNAATWGMVSATMLVVLFLR